MTSFVLIWVAFTTIVGALIAQSKNRSPLMGGVVGFLFNLIGLLVLALLSKRQPGDWHHDR